MSKRRERAKAQTAQLNQQLVIAKEKRNQIYEQKQFDLKIADVLFDFGKLVFGGVLIGGLFEDFEHPYWLYAIGISALVILMRLGIRFYKKGIKK
ncbi:MAG: hypothetical protein IJ067_07595 [Prevotella sp.]|nr:hypothetical protein [Prevotella sp.]